MTIEQRLAGLERQNRVMKGGLGLLLMAAVGGGVLGFAGQQKGGVPDVIRAKMFIVEDDNGKPVVFMTSGPRGGRVLTGNGKGESLVSLDYDAGGNGSVSTYNSKGKEIVVLGATESNEGVLRTINGEGHDLVILAVTTDGNGTVTTYNGKGKEIVEIGATTDGNGTVTTLDGKGHDLVRLGVTTDGEGFITVLDPTGRKRRGVLATRP